MRAAGWRVAGVQRPVATYEPVWRDARLEICTREWRDAPYPEASFDVVTFWHAIEHVPSPHAALAKVSRVLKPGGTLVIAVPDFGGTQARLFRANWFHLDVPRHLFHFSLDSLSALRRRHGFSVVGVGHYSFEYDTFGAVQSALNICCRTKNLLFDLLMRRRSVGGILTGWNPRAIIDLLLTGLLTLPLGLVALPFCWATSWAKRGATIGVYAVNRSGISAPQG